MPGTGFSVTPLVENTSGDAYAFEHGLALWIETPHGPILFDTGQGRTLAANAEQMNIDLSLAHFLVLSHGHCEHCGGAEQILARNDSLMVVHHPGVFEKRYSIPPGEAPRDISMPAATAAMIRSLPPQRVCSSRTPVELLPDVGTTGEIPRANTFEEVDASFFLDRDGTQEDRIRDDQSLWILTEHGLVVICGCAHAGIVNTVHQARRITGEHRVAGIIGGLHLHAASEHRLSETAHTLVDWNVGFVIAGHCTGETAIAYLREHLGSRVRPLVVGSPIRF